MPEHSTKMNDSQQLIFDQYQPRLTKLADACSTTTATQKDANDFTKMVEQRNREMLAEKSSINDYTQYENIIGKLGAELNQLKENQEEAKHNTQEYQRVIDEQRLQLEKLSSSEKKTAEFEKKVSELTEQVNKLKK